MKNTLSKHSPHLLSEIDYEKNKDFDPSKVGFSSTTKIWWKCKNNHSYYASIGSRTRDKGTGCPICANQKLLKGYNDLKSRFPKIAEDWDNEKNYPIKSDDIFPGTNKKYWWKCSNGHSYYKSPASRTNLKTGCPICANKEVLKGYNDIATTNPKILDKWNYEKNNELGIYPDSVTKVSGKKVWWKCEKGHEWLATIAHITYGRGCPICNTGKQTSFPEQAILYYIEQIDSSCDEDYPALQEVIIDIIKNIYNKEIIINLDADRDKIYNNYLFKEIDNSLASNSKIIKYFDKEKNLNVKPEYITRSSGKKVWWKCDKGHSFQAPVHSIDQGMYCPICREELIKKGGLIPLDEKYIKRLKFSDDIKSLALDSPDIAKEWDYDKNYPIKPENVVSRSSKKFWWKCSKCGYEWQTTPLVRTSGRGCKKCGYQSASKKMSKPVLQFTKEGEFIKEYQSIDNAIKQTGILHISDVCRCERKTAGGYIWKYKEKI